MALRRNRTEGGPRCFIAQPALAEFSEDRDTPSDETIDRLFAIDSETIATSNEDGIIRLWTWPPLPNDYNTNSLELVNVFVGHTRYIYSIVAVSSHHDVGRSSSSSVLPKQKKFIASASGDKTVRIWNRETTNCIRILNGHGRSVLCLVSSSFLLEDSTPESSSIVLFSGSRDTTIRVWNVHISRAEEEREKVQQPHNEVEAYQVLEDALVSYFVNCLCELEDGTLMGGYSDGSIRVWRRRKRNKSYEYYYYKQFPTPGYDSVENLFVLSTRTTCSIAGSSEETQIVVSATTADITIWRLVISNNNPSGDTESSKRSSDDNSELEMVVDKFLYHFTKPPQYIISVQELAPGIVATACANSSVQLWSVATGSLLWHTTLFYYNSDLNHFVACPIDRGRTKGSHQPEWVAYMCFDSETQIEVARVLDRDINLVNRCCAAITYPLRHQTELQKLKELLPRELYETCYDFYHSKNTERNEGDMTLGF
eukprot:TRINITY_DN12532_c0_g1_i1.p1 TRINITY_DN12532_c0_g1~~TRINITY_DN12532_c0_g1_i1.p1  ORF type:complete len:483 (-),score=70.90 TRINITY_DN12532_c0_g1_i1:25-1473(-)